MEGEKETLNKSGSSASSGICPVFLDVVNKLFTGTFREYLQSLQPYQPTEVMIEAVSELKGLVNLLSPENKAAVLQLMGNMMLSKECGGLQPE
ncbi:uteroglobin-like isoform X2 [Tachyglossus aculeatus]|uniref:uteroglobin-like isoform X2 n=1 Tax=Tachyglossus aculeatus TaxID=9261 RepID=UPI0018F5C4ED|nr:uteroglobin-like isoform X2 [Tachyglossus aculeatus]